MDSLRLISYPIYSQEKVNMSNGPRGQPSVSGHSNVPTKHPIAYQSHQWASLELCQKDHLLDDPSSQCVVFLGGFLLFFVRLALCRLLLPFFLGFGFEFWEFPNCSFSFLPKVWFSRCSEPNPVKDKDSSATGPQKSRPTIFVLISFLRSFHSHFKFLRKHLHLFGKPLDFQGAPLFWQKISIFGNHPVASTQASRHRFCWEIPDALWAPNRCWWTEDHSAKVAVHRWDGPMTCRWHGPFTRMDHV